MTQPYFVQDRRERDMVDYVEPKGIEVVEHETTEQRAAFWAAWGALGGSLGDLVPRAAATSGAVTNSSEKGDDR